MRHTPPLTGTPPASTASGTGSDTGSGTAGGPAAGPPGYAPAEAAWRPVTVAYRDHDDQQHAFAVLPGEPTPAAGLVIVPARHTDRPGYTGGWSLTHAESGKYVVAGVLDVPLVYAREAAVRLARTSGVDWTRPERHIVGDRAARAACAHLALDVAVAWTTGRPVWWARDSWHPDPAPAAGQPIGQPDGWPGSARGSTEDSADGSADGDPGSAPGGGPGGWLVCAAPLCEHHPLRRAPAVLCDTDPDTDAPTEVRLPTRAAAGDHAPARGWHAHGQHWLCPTCATDHTPDPRGDLDC